MRKNFLRVYLIFATWSRMNISYAKKKLRETKISRSTVLYSSVEIEITIDLVLITIDPIVHSCAKGCENGRTTGWANSLPGRMIKPLI